MPGPTAEKRFSRTSMQIPRSGSRRFSKEEMKLAEDAGAIQLALDGSESVNEMEGSKKLRESMVKNALRRGSTNESD